MPAASCLERKSSTIADPKPLSYPVEWGSYSQDLHQLWRIGEIRPETKRGLKWFLLINSTLKKGFGNHDSSFNLLFVWWWGGHSSQALPKRELSKSGKNQWLTPHAVVSPAGSVGWFQLDVFSKINFKIGKDVVVCFEDRYPSPHLKISILCFQLMNIYYNYIYVYIYVPFLYILYCICFLEQEH